MTGRIHGSSGPVRSLHVNVGPSAAPTYPRQITRPRQRKNPDSGLIYEGGGKKRRSRHRAS